LSDAHPLWLPELLEKPWVGTWRRRQGGASTVAASEAGLELHPPIEGAVPQ
jgi:hypothetical protein